MQTQTHKTSAMLLALVTLALFGGTSGQAQDCRPREMEGVVRTGEAWERPISPTVDLKLEAVPAGWMIRVLPHGAPRPAYDAAELANPPYRSPTPILISTDFAFRAQDAIVWNPRTFRFFTAAEQTAQAESIYQATLRNPGDGAAARRLYPLLARAPEATLQIVDAEISAGTANQSAVAATVASHLEQTAHTIRTDLPVSPLGRLLQMHFRLIVPALGRSCRVSAASPRH